MKAELTDPYLDDFPAKCVSDMRSFYRRDNLGTYHEEISWEMEEKGYSADDFRRQLLQEVERSVYDEAKNGFLTTSAATLAALGPQMGDQILAGMTTASATMAAGLTVLDWRNSRKDSEELYQEVKNNLVIEDRGDKKVMYFDSES